MYKAAIFSLFAITPPLAGLGLFGRRRKQMGGATA